MTSARVNLEVLLLLHQTVAPTEDAPFDCLVQSGQSSLQDSVI
jgi:hypothetical protein